MDTMQMQIHVQREGNALSSLLSVVVLKLSDAPSMTVLLCTCFALDTCSFGRQPSSLHQTVSSEPASYHLFHPSTAIRTISHDGVSASCD